MSKQACIEDFADWLHGNSPLVYFPRRLRDIVSAYTLESKEDVLICVFLLMPFSLQRDCMFSVVLIKMEMSAAPWSICALAKLNGGKAAI